MGDIGKALAAFADARSFTTAVVGHIDETVASELMSLLNVNIDQGNTLSGTLTTLSRILMLAVIGIIVVSMIASIMLGGRISKGIVDPLRALGDRLKTFATGNLSGIRSLRLKHRTNWRIWCVWPGIRRRS